MGFEHDLVEAERVLSLDLDGDCYVTLTRVEVDARDVYRLWWTDHVANDWTEDFADLSAALLRLAVLVKCSEHDWQIGFARGPVTFARYAEGYFGQEVK